MVIIYFKSFQLHLKRFEKKPPISMNVVFDEEITREKAVSFFHLFHKYITSQKST